MPPRPAHWPPATPVLYQIAARSSWTDRIGDHRGRALVVHDMHDIHKFSSRRRVPLILALLAIIFAFAGCAGGAEPVLGAFPSDTVVIAGNFHETASASPSPLRAAVDVGLLLANQSAQPETLLSSARGSCNGAIVARAWRHTQGRLVLAWTSTSLAAVPCPGHALPVIVAPHTAIQLTREIGNTELLGDSLPADTYTFTLSADLASPSLPGEVATSPVAVSRAFIVPPGTVLDGTWLGGADGIVLTLPLHWTADSVTGTGTYQIVLPNTNHCGGGTLRGSGHITFRAARTEDHVTGSMSFDNGWGPPYIAVQTAVGELDGHFMSVDAGPCPMPLTRQVP
jgi:hypothetical protein